MSNNIVEPNGARTALGLGVASFITAWFIPLAGVILGAISLNLGSRAHAYSHTVWAILGIVINAIGSLMLFLLTILWVFFAVNYAPEIQNCMNMDGDAMRDCFQRMLPYNTK